jgi:hypothetical protein
LGSASSAPAAAAAPSAMPPTLSLSSVTMRWASFGPTPDARVRLVLSCTSTASASADGASVPSNASASFAPTPCTVVNRRNQSRSSSEAKP